MRVGLRVHFCFYDKVMVTSRARVMASVSVTIKAGVMRSVRVVVRAMEPGYGTGNGKDYTHTGYGNVRVMIRVMARVMVRVRW